MKRPVAVAVAALLGGCVHAPSARTPPALDALLALSDASRCEPAAAHSDLLEGMLVRDDNFGLRAGHVRVPADLRPAFGRIQLKRHEGWTTIRVPVRGTLFGLALVEIVQAFPEGGDPGDVSYRFGAPADVVERAANRYGLPARAGQTVSLGPPDGYEDFIELQPDPRRVGHSLLTCGVR